MRPTAETVDPALMAIVGFGDEDLVHDIERVGVACFDQLRSELLGNRGQAEGARQKGDRLGDVVAGGRAHRKASKSWSYCARSGAGTRTSGTFAGSCGPARSRTAA